MFFALPEKCCSFCCYLSYKHSHMGQQFLHSGQMHRYFMQLERDSASCISPGVLKPSFCRSRKLMELAPWVHPFGLWILSKFIIGPWRVQQSLIIWWLYMMELWGICPVYLSPVWWLSSLSFSSSLKTDLVHIRRGPSRMTLWAELFSGSSNSFHWAKSGLEGWQLRGI